jgi:hypothetical protein
MYIGGNFGSKHFLAKVIGIAGALSKVTGRPVKFMEDRLDNLMANDSQGPERIYDAELAVTKDGQFLSLRLRTIDDYGAYFIFAITGNTNLMAQITGPYTIRSVETGIKAVLTNKNQQTVFRGAGSALATGCLGAWSMLPPSSWGSIASRSGGATSFSPISSPTRSRPATSTTAVTILASSTWPWSTSTLTPSARSRRGRARRGAIWALG